MLDLVYHNRILLDFTDVNNNNNDNTSFHLKWKIENYLLLTIHIYHNGRRSEIRSIEKKEDYLLSDAIRPGGLEDNLISVDLPI